MKYPCPKCGIERKSLSADCDGCGWSAEPARSPEDIPPPVRMGKTEKRIIGTMAITGVCVGLFFASLTNSLLYGIVVLVPICAGFIITATVLIMEFIIFFSKPGLRPKFSLKSIFQFITVWAVVLLLVQFLYARDLRQLFAWLEVFRGPATLVILPIVVLAGLSWAVLFPAAIAYNAIGVVRYRPAPIFAYVFLSQAVVFLGSLALLFVVKPRWLASWSIIMIVTAVASAAESVLRDTTSAHRRRAMVAILISLHTYLAIIGLHIAFFYLTLV